MEYQVKKKEIISNVEFTNLLSFSLVENKLERNFRTIVEALMLNQAKTDALNGAHLEVKQNHEKQISRINGLIQKMNQNIEHLQNHQQNQKNNEFKPSTHSLSKLPSRKQVQNIASKRSLEKINTQSDQSKNINLLLDDMNHKMKNWQNKWDEQKEQLLKQIQTMKDKVDSVGFLENQLKNFRVQLRIVKDEVTNSLKSQMPQSLRNNNSNKSLLKRQSILNMISNKATDKLLQQPSKNSLKIASKEQNKENHPDTITEINNEEIQKNSLNQALQKEINSIYMELNTLKISFQELRDLLSDNRKQIYKSNNLLSEIKDDLNREVKTRKTETQDLDKAIKDMKMQMLNIENVNINLAQTQDNGVRESQKTAKGGKRQDEDVNYKNQLNDKISRMQAMIQNLVTSSEFNRLKNDLNDQIDKLTGKVFSIQQNMQNTQKKLQDLIVQYQVNTNSDLGQLKNRMIQMEQNIKNESNQNQRKNHILNAKIQQLKKSLQNLREDIEFYQSLMTQNNKNTSKQQNRSQQSPHIQNDRQKGITGVDQKALQALKKYFSGKMHDLRTNLLGLIRDLEKKIGVKPNGEQQIVKIWDRLNEMTLFMNKKADQDDAKKTFNYFEKNINRLKSVLFKNQDNTEDARIARSNNWQCLSCDKNLLAYQGKIGKHVVWDSMPLKGINKSFINQPDDKKKGLPQLKK